MKRIVLLMFIIITNIIKPEIKKEEDIISKIKQKENEINNIISKIKQKENEIDNIISKILFIYKDNSNNNIQYLIIKEIKIDSNNIKVTLKEIDNSDFKQKEVKYNKVNELLRKIYIYILTKNGNYIKKELPELNYKIYNILNKNLLERNFINTLYEKLKKEIKNNEE